MTVYADHDYYTSEYLAGRSAAVTAADFPFYARKASGIIGRYTHGNIKPESIPEQAKMCCCELAEMLAAEHSQDAQNGSVTAESVQGWSVTYESKGERAALFRASVKECVYRWFSGTGLLYSGVRIC